MADKGPNYTVERVRKEADLADHDDTIAAGRARLGAIERGKAANQRRTDLANMDLDAEAASIRENEKALELKKAEIQKNLDAMTTKEKGD